jgi:hypothetical protein
VSDQGYMFMWDKTTANRGSDEIGSCILKFIKMLPQNWIHLVIYSDNCPEQNKNWNICALWLYLVHCNYFESTEHRFILLSTHIFPMIMTAKIEKFSKNHNQAAYDPHGWHQTVLQCNWRKPFHVTDMKSEYFITVHKITGLIIKKSWWEKSCSFRFTQEREDTMFAKYKWKVCGS